MKPANDEIMDYIALQGSIRTAMVRRRDGPGNFGDSLVEGGSREAEGMKKRGVEYEWPLAKPDAARAGLD
jgi:hypothetical protein